MYKYYKVVKLGIFLACRKMAFQRGPSTASKAIPALMSPNYECRNHLNVDLYLKVHENYYIH